MIKWVNEGFSLDKQLVNQNQKEFVTVFKDTFSFARNCTKTCEDEISQKIPKIKTPGTGNIFYGTPLSYVMLSPDGNSLEYINRSRTYSVDSIDTPEEKNIKTVLIGKKKNIKTYSYVNNSFNDVRYFAVLPVYHENKILGGIIHVYIDY